MNGIRDRTQNLEDSFSIETLSDSGCAAASSLEEQKQVVLEAVRSVTEVRPVLQRLDDSEAVNVHEKIKSRSHMVLLKTECRQMPSFMY